VRGLYQERRDALEAAVHRYASELLSLTASPCGLHTAGYFTQTSRSDVLIYKRNLQAGLQTPPLSTYYAGTSPRGRMLIGFTGTSADLIDDAVQKLVAAIGPTRPGMDD